MTDYVDELIAEQGNPNGLLLEILMSDYESWDYVFAVEGPSDKIFFYDFIKSELPGKVFEILPCAGKENLLRFKELAANYEWKNPPIFKYLCDADFDLYLESHHNGVWKTKYYSIESYFVKREYIDYCLHKYANRHLSPVERNDFVEKYETLFIKKALEVRVYCALICEIRASGEHPKFDRFGIDRLFDVSKPEMPRRRHFLKAAIAELEISNAVKAEKVRQRSRSFDKRKFLYWLRGKLAIQIARKCYTIVRSQLPEKVRNEIPGPSLIGAEAFGNAFSFLGMLDNFGDYCRL